MESPAELLYLLKYGPENKCGFEDDMEQSQLIQWCTFLGPHVAGCGFLRNRNLCMLDILLMDRLHNVRKAGFLNSKSIEYLDSRLCHRIYTSGQLSPPIIVASLTGMGLSRWHFILRLAENQQ